ncbi:MAG: ATP synthase subunit I [Desulfuromonadales bacterium]|nr:ATP synthase subunit I [Desulfuromonadales bacterium]
MTDQDAGLETALARRNWGILALMVAVSLFWRSAPVTLGVLGGGLVIALNYHWMGRSLTRLLADPQRAPQRKIFTGINYLLRLVVMGLVIYLLLVQIKVHPIGLAAGLSLYVVNLIYSTIRRIY